MATDDAPRPQFYFEQVDDAPRIVEVAGGIAAVFSCRSPGKMTANEDAAAVIPVGPTSGVLTVADGCGGMASGEVASRTAVQLLAESVYHTVRDGGTLRAAILDGIERANSALRELGSGAATTISVVEIEDGHIRPYHVGDSLILLVGNRGRTKLQTTSHSPVGYAVEAGVIEEHEAIHHEDRHLVSNIVGSPDMHIEIGPRRLLARRDTLVVASDGLADNLHTAEIIARIRKGPLARSAARLARDALERMQQSAAGEPSKPDDLTLIAYRPTQSSAVARGQ